MSFFTLKLSEENKKKKFSEISKINGEDEHFQVQATGSVRNRVPYNKLLTNRACSVSKRLIMNETRQKEQQLRRLFNAKCSIQLDKDDSGFWRSW